MQVIELIDKLDKLPEDAEVVLRHLDGERYEHVTLIYDTDLNEVVLFDASGVPE